ncbi:hypothetical protein S245_040732, partial [Arachis hypogaea]
TPNFSSFCPQFQKPTQLLSVLLSPASKLSFSSIVRETVPPSSTVCQVELSRPLPFH